ncbi:MAG: hypothetical protein KGN78_05715 [Actinomycetales bacterium]|nr:hypothetical protein [Actinomycetales bacterium]
MSEQNEVQVPGFIVNLIGRLVAENEALRAGLIPTQPPVEVVGDEEG